MIYAPKSLLKKRSQAEAGNLNEVNVYLESGILATVVILLVI